MSAAFEAVLRTETRPLDQTARPETLRQSDSLLARKSRNPVVREGENCWKVARAGRASVLVDGAGYFTALESSLRLARESILILGWDFDGRIRLRPDAETRESPPLGELLRTLVEDNDGLEVRILMWSESVVHAPGSTSEMLFGAPWQDHPRIHVKLDTYHPIYAAHHQKIVTIDDRTAYCGGMDLTVGRWDRPSHAIEDSLRTNPDGKTYPPVHDVQMVLDGDAALALSHLAKERWRMAIRRDLPPDCDGSGDAWPPALQGDFADVDIAIARTRPEFLDNQPVREAMDLTIDALEGARKSIYIEAQYMTSTVIGDILERHLRNPVGPEIVVVMAHECHGIIERWVMGTNRDRLIRRLRKADRYGRMRVLYPCIRNDAETSQVFVHSKVVAIDDEFLRIGSSNLNNRSIGLDTECDLAIEGADEEHRRAIASIRDSLLAEHVGSDPLAFGRAVEENGTLIAAIESLNVGERCLLPFEAMHDDGPDNPVWGTKLLDPSRPFRILRLWDRYWRKRKLGR
ncbi:phospholipase D-like domain-containing protein [Aquibium sp. LZ166]|uniref:Phospholipase D n=1 Tax=Aquibium pacificus TaxID=3153579 RepID=A0ABV3SPP2_9HYPH